VRCVRDKCVVGFNPCCDRYPQWGFQTLVGGSEPFLGVPKVLGIPFLLFFPRWGFQKNFFPFFGGFQHFFGGSVPKTNRNTAASEPTLPRKQNRSWETQKHLSVVSAILHFGSVHDLV